MKMPSDEADLLAHATNSVDFYALLSIHPSATDSEIRSGFRKTSLKYHPDKVGASPENVDKFLLVKIAHDVLSDPKVRTLYDQTREAKARKQVESEKLEAGRRKMVSELERRERDARSGNDSGAMGIKRNRYGEEETAAQKLAREVRRISEENRRKKEAMIQKKERELLEEEERLADEKEARDRVQRARESENPKVQKAAPKFSFKKQDDTNPEGATTKAPENDTNFEQSILARLKKVQKSKVKPPETETLEEPMPL